MPATSRAKKSPAKSKPATKAAAPAAARTAAKPAAKSTAKAPAKAAPRTALKPAAKPAARSGVPMELDAVMAELAKAGSEQTRKTYRRHGAEEPMFGVSFATLKVLVKRIGVDHSLAIGLWGTKNHDARVLALKVADPASVSAAELDRFASEMRARMCGTYAAMLAAESPHGASTAREWLAARDERLRATAWALVGCMANLDTATDDEWFASQIARIERSIHTAPNAEREAMNLALIQIGGRSAALRKAALAAAKRIGKVEVDHGDTACKTPDATAYLEKTWAHAESKGFESPAAQERAREPMRLRC